MDYNAIIQLVGSLGFPIAACFAMGYYIVKQMDKMTQSINNNTEAVKDLISLIELRVVEK